MKNTVYIGEFPPPYGGVTTKNMFIKKYIFYDQDISYLDLQKCKRNYLFGMYVVVRIVAAAILAQNIYIGLGLQKRVHFLLALLKGLGGKRALRRTTVFVMASTMPEYCAQHPDMVALLNLCHKLYFELETMFQEMEPFQLDNCALLPNCRNGSNAVPPHAIHTPLKLLFFSRVHPQKGVRVLFDMMDELDKRNIDYTLDFYGPVEPDFAAEFHEGIARYPRAAYKGLFASEKDNLFAKMNEYDVFLLPTTWPGESCCGAIVESKFAGIPAVVSDWHYNKELVQDGEGVVVERNEGKCFAEVIESIVEGTDSYNQMAARAFSSRVKFDFAYYRQSLLKDR